VQLALIALAHVLDILRHVLDVHFVEAAGAEQASGFGGPDREILVIEVRRTRVLVLAPMALSPAIMACGR